MDRSPTPACILADPDGTLLSADARGGVVRSDRRGNKTHHQRRSARSTCAMSERYFRHASNGLASRATAISQFKFRYRLLELMSRDVSSTCSSGIDGLPRQSQLRAARFARIASGSPVDALKPGCTRSNRLGNGILRASTTGASRSWGLIPLTNEIRFDANEKSDVSNDRRVHHTIAPRRFGNVKGREIFGPTSLGDAARGRTASSSTARNLWVTWCTPTAVRADARGRSALLLAKAIRRRCEHSRNDSRTPSPRTVFCDDLAWRHDASVTFGGADLQTMYIVIVKWNPDSVFSARHCLIADFALNIESYAA